MGPEADTSSACCGRMHDDEKHLVAIRVRLCGITTNRLGRGRADADLAEEMTVRADKSAFLRSVPNMTARMDGEMVSINE